MGGQGRWRGPWRQRHGWRQARETTRTMRNPRDAPGTVSQSGGLRRRGQLRQQSTRLWSCVRRSDRCSSWVGRSREVRRRSCPPNDADARAEAQGPRQAARRRRQTLGRSRGLGIGASACGDRGLGASAWGPAATRGMPQLNATIQRSARSARDPVVWNGRRF